MKMCKDHWARIKQAIDDRGLTHLVAKSDQEIEERITKELDGEEDPKDFDPLMSMNSTLFGLVLERMGLVVLVERDEAEDGMPPNDGHVCPLCIIRKGYDNHNTPTGQCGDPECTVRMKPGELPWDENHIRHGADAMRQHAIELGLVPRPS